MVNNQPTVNRNSSAIQWGLLGARCAPKGKEFLAGIACAIASPLLDKLSIELERVYKQEVLRQVSKGLFLPAPADASEQISANMLENAQASPIQSPDKSFDKIIGKPTLADLVSVQPKLSVDPQTIEAGKWLNLIRHPSTVLILGKRGSGKSALGHRLLEHLRWTASPYVIGLPKDARKYLPDWIGMAASLEDVPPKAIVLVDEAYMPYHARSSMAVEARAMSQLVNLSRQREQTLIFVSQEARQIDRNIASSADIVIFKDLGMLQLKFDRPELNDIAKQAMQAFAALGSDKQKWAFVYAPERDFMGLMENSLPTFWREKLSHIFAIGGQTMARAPKKTPLNERIEKAKQLKQQGLSLGQIAKLMGVSKPTIKNYLEGYPYKA